MADKGVSLRPMSLRPGGGGAGANPFAKFGKGAGLGLKAKVADRPIVEEKKKPPGEVIRYNADFLMKFSELNTKIPPELLKHPEVLMDEDGEAAKAVLAQAAPVAAEPADDRDWRTRQQQPSVPGQDQAPAQVQQAGQGQQQWQSRGQPQGGNQGGNQGQAPRESKQQAAPEQQANGGASSQRSAAPAPKVEAAPQARPAPQASGKADKIQKAEDIGRKAWAPGAISVEGNEKAVRQVKGILNKLTPENFERLLQQLVDHVTNVLVLQSTIALIFENAVAQPTFVAMYANLCDQLAKTLPEFESLEEGSGGRTLNFRQVLLNTCQDEFESAAIARKALATASEERKASDERLVKQRTIGNIRLVAELYKKSVVPEKIVNVCIVELLEGHPKIEPHEDNVEAMCELLTIAGKTLEGTSKAPARVDGYYATLSTLSQSKTLAPRIKFMIRDLLDLKRSSWIPRRETLQAKKLDDIRAEAHAELGMVAPVSGLETLSLPGLGAVPVLPALAGRDDDIDLFPAFRGEYSEWQTISKQPAADKESKSSAFLGEYTPIETAVVAPATPVEAAEPTPSAAAGEKPSTTAAAAPVTKAKVLTPEERESRAKGLFSEFVSVRDTAEALLCTKELAAPGFMPELVKIGIQAIVEGTATDKEQAALSGLLVALCLKGGYTSEDFSKGLLFFTEQLEDYGLDNPKAGQLLGDLLGQAVVEKALPLSGLPALVEKIEDTECRRNFVATTLKFIKASAGEEGLKKLCAEADFKAGEILKGDPEFDSHLPDIPTFLKKEGLSAVPV